MRQGFHDAMLGKEFGGLYLSLMTAGTRDGAPRKHVTLFAAASQLMRIGTLGPMPA
jgi:hypothetical protein